MGGDVNFTLRVLKVVSHSEVQLKLLEVKDSAICA